MSEYKLSPAKKAEAEIIERKSRFIGYISPVSSEEEARAFIETIKEKHFDATHNVWAYVLRGGADCPLFDDGEPQGTAGLPTLEVLRKSGLDDCVVVVTRYFEGYSRCGRADTRLLCGGKSGGGRGGYCRMGAFYAVFA